MNVAAIDIGSNSLRLLVLDQTGRELARELVITRLATGVDATRQLSDAAMERTAVSLRAYRQLLDVHGVDVDSLRVTTTSASRDATNREAFFDLVAQCVGKRPDLLSGPAEAALSFAGATSWLAPRANEWG